MWLERGFGASSPNAMKKIGGKRKEHALGTADRKIAERRFKEWVDSFGKVDSDGSPREQSSQPFLEFSAVAPVHPDQFE